MTSYEEDEYLDFEIIGEKESSIYGKTTLIRDPSTGVVYLSKDKVFNSKENAEKMAELLNLRIENPNLYYVSPYSFEIGESNAYTPGLYTISVLLQNPDEDLQKELQNTKNYLSEFRILTLIYDCLIGLSHLEELGICHSCLNPSFIARTTTGYAIVDDPLIDRNRIEERNKPYHSPESLKASIKGERLGERFSIAKSDVFSLGIIILEAGIIKEISGTIFTLAGVLDFIKLGAFLQEFEARFGSDSLASQILHSMLIPIPHERPTFWEILSRLPRYEVILNHFEGSPHYLDPIPSRTITEALTKISPISPKYEQVLEPMNQESMTTQIPQRVQHAKNFEETPKVENQDLQEQINKIRQKYVFEEQVEPDSRRGLKTFFETEITSTIQKTDYCDRRNEDGKYGAIPTISLRELSPKSNILARFQHKDVDAPHQLERALPPPPISTQCSEEQSGAEVRESMIEEEQEPVFTFPILAKGRQKPAFKSTIIDECQSISNTNEDVLSIQPFSNINNSSRGIYKKPPVMPALVNSGIHNKENFPMNRSIQTSGVYKLKPERADKINSPVFQRVRKDNKSVEAIETPLPKKELYSVGNQIEEIREKFPQKPVMESREIQTSLRAVAAKEIPIKQQVSFGTQAGSERNLESFQGSFRVQVKKVRLEPSHQESDKSNKNNFSSSPPPGRHSSVQKEKVEEPAKSEYKRPSSFQVAPPSSFPPPPSNPFKRFPSTPPPVQPMNSCPVYDNSDVGGQCSGLQQIGSVQRGELCLPVYLKVTESPLTPRTNIQKIAPLSSVSSSNSYQLMTHQNGNDPLVSTHYAGFGWADEKGR